MTVHHHPTGTVEHWHATDDERAACEWEARELHARLTTYAND